jgi:hypothetical protein
MSPRPFVLLLLACASAFAVGLKEYVPVFESKYKISKASELRKADCRVCHTSQEGEKVNPYGKDLRKAMKAAGVRKLTAEILAKVEGADSDGDGMKNLDEIEADRNPGVPDKPKD